MNLQQTSTTLGVGLGILLSAVALLWLAGWLALRWIRARGIKGDSVLTVLAAVVGTTFTAEGMWMFFRDTVGLTVFLTAAGFLFFELLQIACAVRARRKMRDAEIGHAGAEGVVLWLSAATSGFFSSTHSSSWEEALMRLTVPIGVAWLWHQQMGLERQELNLAAKFEGIHWRITPERILAFLRIAEPTARTTQQVTAHRALEALAMAVQRAQAPLFGWGWPARRRLRRALRRAVKDASLDTDPAAQRKLTATLGVLGGEVTLLDLNPTAPWVATMDDQISRARAFVEDHGVEIDERTRVMLGLPATTPRPPRPGRLPSLFHPIPLSAPAHAGSAPGNQTHNQLNGHATAGQKPALDLAATINAAIQKADAEGLSEREIARKIGISRDRVRVVLGKPRRGRRPTATIAQPATVNGNSTGGQP